MLCLLNRPILPTELPLASRKQPQPRGLSGEQRVRCVCMRACVERERMRLCWGETETQYDPNREEFM